MLKYYLNYNLNWGLGMGPNPQPPSPIPNPQSPIILKFILIKFPFLIYKKYEITIFKLNKKCIQRI